MDRSPVAIFGWQQTANSGTRSKGNSQDRPPQDRVVWGIGFPSGLSTYISDLVLLQRAIFKFGFQYSGSFQCFRGSVLAEQVKWEVSEELQETSGLGKISCECLF